MEISGVNLNELEFENIGSWPPLLRGLIFIIVCITTIYFGYTLDLSGKMDALSAAKEKKTQTEKLFFETQQNATNLGAYKEEVKTVTEQLNKLTEQLPSNNEESGLLEDISQQAANNALQFIAIKPGKESDKGFYHENPIELDLSGDYNGFGEFSSKVASMKRIVTFHGFSMRKNDTKAKGALLMQVLVKTYWVSGKGRNQ